jgi:hypothetical protein
MIKINLLDNLIPEPLVQKPDWQKIQIRWKEMENKKRKITMCGCGNHPVNIKKDVYMQHNNWVMQFHPKMESGRTNLHQIKGLNKEPCELQYDFSGEEHEITSTELREFGDESI